VLKLKKTWPEHSDHNVMS